MSNNNNLNAAKRAKNDEFYTLITDIENELQHYKDFFRGKAVYCNCDSPTESNFPRYFLEHFGELGLERITATCHVPGGRGLKGEKRKGGEYTVEQLDGDGDFRSEECVELLKEADVVVGNPPFSLFREYIAQLMEYGKKFLIIGNKNAIAYKEIFPYIKENKLWLGVSSFNTGMYFGVPDNYQYATTYKFAREINGEKVMRVSSICWFTNIPHAPVGKPLILEKRYSPEDYPKYDNYDAIEVSKVKDIPVDYDGVMGVPLTYIQYHSKDQFEIVGCSYQYGDCGKHLDNTEWGCMFNGKPIYKRLFIRRKDALEPADFDILGATESEGVGFSNGLFSGGSTKQALVDGNRIYKRLFIRRK